MKKLIFLALPLFILFAASNLNLQDASKKNHHTEKDTTKKEACCSTDSTKSGDCCSESKDAHNHDMGNKEDKSVKKIWNSVCPVTGEAIEPGAPTVEHDGKLVALCCKGCVSKFQKDPAKFLKTLDKDGKALKNKS